MLHEGHAVVILDGVDELPDGYRIRSHDLRGALPDTLIPRRADKEQAALEACIVYALAMRDR